MVCTVCLGLPYLSGFNWVRRKKTCLPDGSAPLLFAIWKSIIYLNLLQVKFQFSVVEEARPPDKAA